MIKQLSESSVAGNANSDFTVGDKKSYKVLYMWIALTTDATVANRYVSVTYRDSADNILFGVRSAVAHAASLVYNYGVGPGMALQTANVDNIISVPLPNESIIPEDGYIRVNVDNGVVGDSFNVFMIVDENPNIVSTVR